MRRLIHVIISFHAEGRSICKESLPSLMLELFIMLSITTFSIFCMNSCCNYKLPTKQLHVWYGLVVKLLWHLAKVKRPP